MGKAQRVKIIEQLQNERGTFVISYITSTRQNLEVEMAMDAIRKIYEHLRLIGKPREEARIDLFIHSNGGDGTVPWRLVTLIREYTDEFCVLVPHRAFSAATLTALGADRIIMHPMGMLGPTDPTVANPFNPPDPKNPNQRVGISVEDVTSYIALIKEDAGIEHDEQMVHIQQACRPGASSCARQCKAVNLAIPYDGKETLGPTSRPEHRRRKR